MIIGKAIRKADRTLLYVEGPVRSVPIRQLPGNSSLRLLDHDRPSDIALWLDAINDAFKRDWGESEYERYLTKNAYLEVSRTLVLSSGNETLGFASLGHFRQNPARGALHYIAVRTESQARGAGPALVSRCCQQLAEEGFRLAENEIPAGRVHSLKMHHRLGFRIKPLAESWNTPPSEPLPIRTYAQLRARAQALRWD